MAFSLNDYATTLATTVYVEANDLDGVTPTQQFQNFAALHEYGTLTTAEVIAAMKDYHGV